MSLVDTREMFKKAYKGRYAIGAFNVCNMEIVQGISRACQELNSPIIFQVSPGAGKYAGYEYLKSIVEVAVKNSGIEAALHLDHGNSFALCKKCIDMGFTSVMIDGSSLSFEDNVSLTSRVVDYASSRNVSVEGELGCLQGIEGHVEYSDKHSIFTDPMQAKDFVEKTGVNSLAIAIGTSHGVNKFGADSVPSLRFDILEEIGNLIPGLPIVLHGASSVNEEVVNELHKYGVDMKDAKGIPEEMLRKASLMSVCKINIDSDLRLSVTLAIRKFMEENETDFDPRGYLGYARTAVCDLVKNKILKVFRSNNKNQT